MACILLCLAASELLEARTALAGQPTGDRPELVAVVPATMPPLHFTGAENKPEGFAVQVFRDVATRAGYTPKIIIVASPAQAEEALLNGQAQVLAGYGISPERQGRMVFTTPFEYQPVHIFFRTSSPRLETLASLRGKRVALIRGSIPLEKLADDPNIDIHIVPTLSEAIFNTLSGEVDALVFQHRLVSQAARAAGVEQGLLASAQPVFEAPRALALRKEDTALHGQLQRALEAYRDTPEFQTLFAQWHADPHISGIPPETLWISGGVAALLMGMLLAWRYVSVVRVNRRLTKALTERDSALAALLLTEERQGSLLALSHMQSASADEIITFALEEGVRLTGSQMGYLCFLEDGMVDLERFHWSTAARAACAMTSISSINAYPADSAGLWAECLRTLSPHIVNDYPNHAGARGLPEGHAPVLRHMAVPVVEDGRVTMVFGVGNKPAPYDEADARQLQLFLIGLWHIVQAKQAAVALVQAKDYAEELIQGANAMCIRLDRQGRVTLLNAAGTELTGYSQAEVLGQQWFQLTRSPEEAASITARYAQYMSGELPLPHRHEAALRTKNGRVLHLAAQNSLLRQNGEPVGLLSFGIDLTERKQAERNLAMSEEKFRSLAEDSPALICRFQPGGVITYANSAYCRAFGTTQEALLGTSFLNLIPESEREGIAEHFRTLTPESPVKSYEHQVLLPEGGLAWQSWTDRAVFNAQGETVAYQSVGMDITERKQTEAELRRLHYAMEQAAEGVVITDDSGALLFVNPAFERMAGLREPGTLQRGQSVLDVGQSKLLHQDSHLVSNEDGKSWHGGVTFRSPSGATVEVELSLAAIRDGGGQVSSYVALCHDVTERKRLERQLWQAQKMEALGTLAGGIAHDFNNILASIMGFTELALDDTPTTSRAHGSLERVLKASNRAKELVRQILSFSRRSPAEHRRFNAGQAVSEALKLLEASLPKNITIHHEHGQEVCSVLADPSQIHQVVMNLCTNAAQAMKDSGGNITVRTGMNPAAGHSFELVVQDDGPGIAPEVLGRVFDPFFTTKATGEGTGLGLAVVHGITTGLGGSLSVESTPGEGARFTVLLPATGQAAPAPAETVRTARQGRGRIVFVDDEADILALASQALSPLGYNIRTYERGAAALDAVRQAPDEVDLVITDQSMPGMAGTALAESLRDLRPTLPIIISSGFSQSIPPERLQSLEPVLLLPKPYSMGELAESIRRALGEGKGGGDGPESYGGG